MPENLDHCLVDDVHWVGALQAFVKLADCIVNIASMLVLPAVLLLLWEVGTQKSQPQKIVAISWLMKLSLPTKQSMPING